jgi:hypothetical protein
VFIWDAVLLFRRSPLGMRSRGLGVEVAVGFLFRSGSHSPEEAGSLPGWLPERRSPGGKEMAQAGSGHTGKPRARRPKATGKTKASRAPPTTRGASWAIPGRSFQQKKQPSGARLSYVDRWLVDKRNADTQHCAASRGDCTQIRVDDDRRCPVNCRAERSSMRLVRRRHHGDPGSHHRPEPLPRPASYLSGSCP